MAQSYEARMMRVLDHIHDHPAGDLSLDALADIAALSRFHFHRVFRGMIGETAAQAVRRMRLHHASVALVTGTDPMAKIARRVGYPNQTSFTRAFTDAYAMPPSVFRNRGELRPCSPDKPQKGQTMYSVELRTCPARPLAAMAHSGAYFTINRTFEKLFATLGARHLLGQTGYLVGVFYDDPSETPDQDMRSHAGVDMAADTALSDPLERIVLPAGRHAVLRYTGPYAGLPAAYDQLYGTWLPASDELVADSPSFEVYLNSPMDTPAEELVTELFLPLKG